MRTQTAKSAGTRPVFKISEPETFRNLSIFLIDGEESGGFDDLLTLEEAIDQDLFTVHETAEVNTLAVENLSKEFGVFIQCGDIVKGGMQDRVLSASIIVPKESGRVPIESFCVESGRWSARGSEAMHRFSSAKERIASKELKSAALFSRSQGEVWEKVSEAQSKLSNCLRMNVADAESPSSLLLSLENEHVRASAEDYVAALKTALEARPQAVGFAYTVNGRVQGAEIFPSRRLFGKLWSKLVRAAAVEAVAESSDDGEFETPSKKDVREFLRRAERGRRSARDVGPSGHVATGDAVEMFSVESTDTERDSFVHKSYVRK